jgi:hypothetical protein
LGYIPAYPQWINVWIEEHHNSILMVERELGNHKIDGINVGNEAYSNKGEG